MYDSFHLLWEKEKNEGLPFWQIVMEEDMSEQNISKEEAFHNMTLMYQAMKDSDLAYDPALKSNSGLSGTDGAK